jgi:hypothetical protein
LALLPINIRSLVSVMVCRYRGIIILSDANYGQGQEQKSKVKGASMLSGGGDTIDIVQLYKFRYRRLAEQIRVSAQ